MEYLIIYYGYNICDLVKIGVLLCFIVKELRVMCDNFELLCKLMDKKFILIGYVIDMVKECSCL